MIYLVEDDDSIRELVIYTLRSTGMDAKGFGLPSEYWHAMEEQLPELVLLFFFVFPIWKRICNPGNLAGILVCLFLLFVTIFPRKFAHIVQRCWEPLGGKIGLSAVGILLAAGLTFSAVMSVQMVRTICTKPTAPETVVVLGCKVRGTRPSRMLIRRLEAAQAYLEENPDVLCITTGGQGAGEDVPEGQAMRDWLIGHGIAAERIIAEDTSKDTQENLEHAAAILQEQGLGKQVVIITDGFHQYRASLLAKRAGLQSESVCAKTNPLYVPTYWVREWMALGTVFGLPLLSRPVLPMAGMPAGGFIVLGILCAIWRALAQHRKNYLKTEARNTVAVHHQKEANREHE